MQLKTRIVIPARLKSTRLPEKLLLNETGKTLIQHTYEAATKSSLADDVIVAADSREIVDVVESFGGKAIMTDANHPSGTDRIAEVARQDDQFDIYVNIQGDEPEIEANSIDLAIDTLKSQDNIGMTTLARPISDPALISEPSCVKVVLNSAKHAIYFSRAAIPFCRDKDDTDTEGAYLQHVGLYAYRRDFLLTISEMPPGRLEQMEKLEQLRVLEAGYPIGVAIVADAPSGIDTPEDYAAFVRRQNS